MTYLIFPTKPEAIAADRQIAKNFGMGSDSDDTTRRYQSTHEQVDGTWFFPTPAPVVIYLPALFTPGPDITQEDGTVTPSGTWSYPTLTSDSLADVTGYTRADTVDPMPPPEATL